MSDPNERFEREQAAEAQSFIGQTVGGKYVITRQIGAGGMAFVFEAENRQLHDRRYAVKVLRHFIASVPSNLERFKRECEVMSRLSGPNFPSVVDFGEIGDRSYYLVMEFVEGKTLADEIRQYARFTDEVRTLRIAIQAARALEEAHAKGFVHRDLKPDNIILVPIEQGRDLVKVMDFGIAQVAATAARPNAPRLTTAQERFGTPWYMSPEQVKGQTMDGRSDIYSLGIILYEMVAGDVPFGNESQHKDKTPEEVMLMHVTHDPTPLRDVSPRPLVSDDLTRIIMRMIAKKPEERYPDVVKLRTDLELQLARVEKERAQRYVSVRPAAATSPHLTEDEIRIRESAPTITPEGHARTADRQPPYRSPPPPKASDSSAPTAPAPIAEPEPSEPPEPSSASVWMIALVILAALGLAGGLWYFGHTGSADDAAVTPVVADAHVPAHDDHALVVPVVPTVRDAGAPDTYVAPPPSPPPVAPVPARRDAGTRRHGPCVPNFITGEGCP